MVEAIAPDDAPPFFSRRGLNLLTLEDRMPVGEAALEGDLDFYVDAARDAGGPVLELGAGTGRVCRAIARAGETVTGLELSPAMIAHAEERCRDLSPRERRRIRFVQGDMGEFSLSRYFPLAIVPYRGFQALLTPAEQRSCLETVRRHLHPDGRLIVHIFDPRLDWCVPDSDAVPEIRQEAVHPESGNRVVVEVLRWHSDPVAQVADQLWRFRELDDDGEVVVEEHERLRFRWTYRWEMRYLLELSGFQVVAQYSDFRGSPPAYGREQIWVVRRG